MIRIGLQTTGYGNQFTIDVPEGAVSIRFFSAVGNVLDPVTGATRAARAVIAAETNLSFADIIGGQAQSLLFVADQNFPSVPVSAGERLLVAFEDTCSAVIFFDTAQLG